MGAPASTARDDAFVELSIPGPVPARLRVHGWSHGLSVERQDGDAWESLEGDPGLFRLVGEHGALPPSLEPIRATIPAPVQAQAAPFALGQLVVLRMLQTPDGDELVRLAPTLAWLVACRLAEGAVAPVSLAELVGLPRRELLAFALGRATATAAMVRAAARFGMERFDADELGVLRALLVSGPALDAARRHRRWELRDLRHLLRFPRIAERPYLPELLDLVGRGGIDALLDQETVFRDTERMAQALDHADVETRLRGVTSLAALARLHDALVLEYNAQAPETRRRGPPMPARLPPPPLPGDGRIEPLRTPADYVAEGRSMGHCVTSYAHTAARGACAVYRLDEPERATVEVRIRGASLTLGQVRGPNNRPVAPSTRAEVERWFDAAVHARAHDAGADSNAPPPTSTIDEEEP